MKRKLLVIIVFLFLTELVLVAQTNSPYARRIRPFFVTPPSCIENEIGYNMTTHVLLICNNTLTYQPASSGGAGSFTTLTTSGSTLLAPTVTIGTQASATLRLGQKLDIITSANYGGMSLSTWSATAGESSIFDFNRSRSATIGTMTSVAAFDPLGVISFRGADGTNFLNFASIIGAVDNVSPGSNDAPGKLSFYTTPDGSATLAERLIINNAGLLQFQGQNAGFPAIKRNGTALNFRLADDSGDAPITAAGITASGQVSSRNASAISLDAGTAGTQAFAVDSTLRTIIRTHLFFGAGPTLADSATAPTISSGFGASPSVTTNNGTMAFTINVGTGGSATNGVIALPAASTGWVCWGSDLTTQSSTVFMLKQIASSTTSATIANFNTAGAQAAWVASDILSISCRAR